MQVKLTYFKKTGKLYTEADYETRRTEFYSIITEVRELLSKGALPGLVAGANDFVILVQVPDHPLGGEIKGLGWYPHLILPEE